MGVIEPNDAVAEPPLFRVLSVDGRNLLSVAPELSPSQLLHIYRVMVLVRCLDERMVILQRQGRVGFYGACTGQEAPPVATAAALLPEDWIFPSLREGGAMLYRGFSLESYVCQVFGNAGDPAQGRQMPSHQSGRSVRQVSWSSCIGTQLPQAVGAGIAMAQSSAIAVAFLGDGATSTVDFHNALCAVTSLPSRCLFICQNNHWSISVPTHKQTRVRTLAERAYGYGLAFARVDGNDPLAIYAAVSEAADHIRKGHGSVLIEMETYRIGAHSSSDDPSVYRDEAEVAEWRAKDPIRRLKAYLESGGIWDNKQETELTKELRADVVSAVEFAERWPKPHIRTLFEDVLEVPESPAA